jgi:hypothetical protein
MYERFKSVVKKIYDLNSYLSALTLIIKRQLLAIGIPAITQRV